MHSSPAKVGITQITPPCYLLAQLSEGGGQDGASFVYSGIVYGNRLALFGNKYGGIMALGQLAQWERPGGTV